MPETAACCSLTCSPAPPAAPIQNNGLRRKNWRPVYLLCFLPLQLLTRCSYDGQTAQQTDQHYTQHDLA